MTEYLAVLITLVALCFYFRSLSSLRFILVIGIGCHIIASILCCFLDTKYNLGDRSEAAQTQQVETQLQRKREISVARGEAEATGEFYFTCDNHYCSFIILIYCMTKYFTDLMLHPNDY